MIRQSAQASDRDGQADFDFLIGEWKVHNRRLQERLKGSLAWDDFEGTLATRKIWNGLANISEYEGNSPSGLIRGMGLRLYEASSRQWRIYWANQAKGILDQPMVGAFENGCGEFYSHELFEGKSVYVRYLWSSIGATSCKWEQAFSADGGTTWETNWTMEFTRVK